MSYLPIFYYYCLLYQGGGYEIFYNPPPWYRAWIQRKLNIFIYFTHILWTTTFKIDAEYEFRKFGVSYKLLRDSCSFPWKMDSFHMWNYPYGIYVKLFSFNTMETFFLWGKARPGRAWPGQRLAGTGLLIQILTDVPLFYIGCLHREKQIYRGN